MSEFPNLRLTAPRVRSVVRAALGDVPFVPSALTLPAILLALSCLPQSRLTPPKDDDRLIDVSEGVPAGPDNPQIRREGSPIPVPSTSGTPEVLAESPFQVVTTVTFPAIARSGNSLFVLAEGHIAELRDNELQLDGVLTQGADVCAGEMDMKMLGHFPARAWLQLKYPPFDESPPIDVVLRWAPGAERWVRIGAKLLGGAHLMVWGDALIGYETHWGAPREEASIRLFDGKLPGPLPAFQATSESNCPGEFGGLSLESLGDRLLLTKMTCTEESMSLGAVFWTKRGAEGAYAPLPLEGEDLASSGGGPVATAGEHTWYAFGSPSTERGASLLHYFGKTWQRLDLSELSPIVSLSALPDGAVWFVSGENESELWQRTGDGKLRRLAVPGEIGDPRQVIALSPNDVWVTGTEGVGRTGAMTKVVSWPSRPCGDDESTGVHDASVP